MAQGDILDLTIGGKLPSTWVHSASKKLLNRIFLDIPTLPQFTPHLMACLECTYHLVLESTEHHQITGLHMGRVGRLSGVLATQMDLPWQQRLECILGGWLHDVGKRYISPETLDKPGKLTDEEFALIRKHVEFGVNHLENYTELHPFLDPVRYHHERWDGNGYPNGIKGPEIPITARVVTVADAYDAMTHFRPYIVTSKSHEEAFQEVDRSRGTHFDPQVASAFLSLTRREVVNIV